MPIIDMSVEILTRHVNADNAGRQLGIDELREAITQIGCEVEEVADTRQYVCDVCGKIFDRTEAQGPPLDCPQCGTDYRDQADALSDLGANTVVRLDMLADRPDIYDAGGMARCLRGYLGLRTGLSEYTLSDATISIKVDPKLSDDASRRPFISCAVLRNVSLGRETIKILMNLQENLHWALGRDRKLASIGAYDLDTLSGTAFRYDAVAPDELKFVPLGFPPDLPSSMLTPGQILEMHRTGRKYAKLLAGFRAYPLLRDASGSVLSMPPIINSEATRVTQKTRNIFIDVTGLSQRTVDRALNVMVANLKELLPEVEIESVNIDAPDGNRVTPDLAPSRMTLSVREAADTIGISLDAAELTGLLERMGHTVESRGTSASGQSARGKSAPGGAGDADTGKSATGGPAAADTGKSASDASATDKSAADGSGDGETLTVLSPAYRNDIMHPVDLIEDAAIAYGYHNLEPALVPTFTVGKPREIEERCAIARRVMTGLGFHQVMTLALTCEAAAFDKWRLPHDERRVLIANPISTEQTMCRVSLLPGLLETLAINKQYDLPQFLFEVGDVCFLAPQSETGAREERYIAVAMIGTHIGYADIRAVADAFAHEMGARQTVRTLEHDSFISGRAAALFVVSDQPAGRSDQPIGVMGEVHPGVLENYGLKHAVSVLELSVEKLLSLA